jgi:EF-P beta-lysylation protein EpmB
MITASPLRAQPASQDSAVPPRKSRWQELSRDAVTDPHELLDMLGLGHRAVELIPVGDTGFPLRVPRGFVARMRRGDANDPLLRQVLAVGDELLTVPGFVGDAVGDMDARSARGVLHKYEGRALLIATGSCAVHCRYCFRRHFDYAQDTAAAHGWTDAIKHIREDETIEEVIFSGGDPLSLSTPKLIELTDALASIGHIRRLRIHTRLPVVLPERVDDALCGWLSRLRWPVAVVVHANHANEIDEAVHAAMTRLRDARMTLLNQSVLLRGVNDSVEALAALSERLFAAGVLPYYLHQLDRVAGTAHFEVDDVRALQIMTELRGRLSGYLVPRLVREIAGESSKTPV